MKDNVKVLSKNGYKDDPAKGGCEEQILGKDEMKAFRMLAARLNYVAQDDPTIQFAAKELCRKMSSPTSQDFAKLKKLVRFLVGVKEVLWEYPWQDEREATAIKIQVDSDLGWLRANSQIHIRRLHYSWPAPTANLVINSVGGGHVVGGGRALWYE